MQRLNKGTITLGAGCFWCVEAVFSQLNGVLSVQSGYMGGHLVDPTYKLVCEGQTGHVEVAQIEFDPELITLDKILEVFWTTHDPTTMDRQGNDVGTQYRSAIFYRDQNQKEVAEKSKKSVATTIWDNPIVTKITAVSTFYRAEEYHDDYFSRNPNAGYCSVVIDPKVQKFRHRFTDYLK